MKLFEHGKVVDNSGHGFVYHQVFTDGKYVYDPRLSSSAVPKGDWTQMIRGLNPGALIKGVLIYLHRTVTVSKNLMYRWINCRYRSLLITFH